MRVKVTHDWKFINIKGKEGKGKQKKEVLH